MVEFQDSNFNSLF